METRDDRADQETCNEVMSIISRDKRRFISINIPAGVSYSYDVPLVTLSYKCRMYCPQKVGNICM